MEDKAITHEQLVSALVKPGIDIANELSGLEAHLWHMSSALAYETGELGDAIKKVVIYHKPIDMQNVIEELGDIEFYLEGLRQGLGIKREETLQHNIAKLTKRYGEKYSDKAAQDRADKSTEA